MSTARIAIGNTRQAQASPATAAKWAKSQTQTPSAGAVAEMGVLGEFSDLYHEYFPKVFAYVYGRVQDKEVSLDIVSDVFEKAFIKKKSLRSPESFASWLFTIARTEVSSHWRKEKPPARAAQEAASEHDLHPQPRGPEETVLHR